MKHEIISDLENRYTTKKYDPSKKVSADDLAVLLEAYDYQLHPLTLSHGSLW